jgi:hypothetical protein
MCVHSVFGQSQAELVRGEPKSSADEPTTRFSKPGNGHQRTCTCTCTVDRTTLNPVPVPNLGQLLLKRIATEQTMEYLYWYLYYEYDYVR